MSQEALKIIDDLLHDSELTFEVFKELRVEKESLYLYKARTAPHLLGHKPSDNPSEGLQGLVRYASFIFRDVNTHFVNQVQFVQNRYDDQKLRSKCTFLLLQAGRNSGNISSGCKLFSHDLF